MKPRGRRTVVLGTIEVELVFSRPVGRGHGSAIVPPEAFDGIEAARQQYGVQSEWRDDLDPVTSTRRPAFLPILGGPLALCESRGIRHGDRFLGTLAVLEVAALGRTVRQLHLADARPVGAPPQERDASRTARPESPTNCQPTPPTAP